MQRQRQQQYHRLPQLPRRRYLVPLTLVVRVTWILTSRSMTYQMIHLHRRLAMMMIMILISRSCRSSHRRPTSQTPMRTHMPRMAKTTHRRRQQQRVANTVRRAIHRRHRCHHSTHSTRSLALVKSMCRRLPANLAGSCRPIQPQQHPPRRRHATLDRHRHRRFRPCHPHRHHHDRARRRTIVTQ